MRKVLLDAGVLLRFVIQTDPNHGIIRVAVHNLILAGNELCYTSQSICEMWNALTRPAANNGYGVSIAEAQTAINIIEDEFVLLEDFGECFVQWKQLVRTHGVMGKNVHDANLVASSLAHGVRHIATLNERDFRRYAEIEIVSITLDGR